MTHCARRTRTGRFVLAEMSAEWHVLFTPDDLPWHYLSVARFQDRGRALAYAGVEDMMADDELEPNADVSAMVRVIDPKASPRSEAAPSGGEITENPSPGNGLTNDPTTEGIGGDQRTPETIVDVEKTSADKAVAPVIPAAAVKSPTPTAKPLPPAMAAAKERALDHYAEHGGSQAEVAAQTGVPPGSLSGFLSVARKAGDPRIAAGDAKREMTPRLAKVIGPAAPASAVVKPVQESQPVALPVPQPAVVAPAQPVRKLTTAEMIENAKRAAPAPTFSRPGGASVRTG